MSVIMNRTDDEKSNVEERETYTPLNTLIETKGPKIASNDDDVKSDRFFTVLPLQNCSMGPGSRSRKYTLPFGTSKKKSPSFFRKLKMREPHKIRRKKLSQFFQWKKDAYPFKDDCSEYGQEDVVGKRRYQKAKGGPPPRPSLPSLSHYPPASCLSDVPLYPEIISSNFEWSQHTMCATIEDMPQTWTNDYMRNLSHESKTYPNKQEQQSDHVEKIYPCSGCNRECDNSVQSLNTDSNGDIWDMVSVDGAEEGADMLSPMRCKPPSEEVFPTNPNPLRGVVSTRHPLKPVNISNGESRPRISYPPTTKDMVEIFKRLSSSPKQDDYNRKPLCNYFEPLSCRNPMQNFGPTLCRSRQLNFEQDYSKQPQYKCKPPLCRSSQINFGVKYKKKDTKTCLQPPFGPNLVNFQQDHCQHAQQNFETSNHQMNFNPSWVHCGPIPQEKYETSERNQQSSDPLSSRLPQQDYDPLICRQARKGCEPCSKPPRFAPPIQNVHGYHPSCTSFQGRFHDNHYDFNGYKDNTESLQKFSPSKCLPVSDCGLLNYPQDDSYPDPDCQIFYRETPTRNVPRPLCSQMFDGYPLSICPALSKCSNSANIPPAPYFSCRFTSVSNKPLPPRRYKPYQIPNLPKADTHKPVILCRQYDGDLPKCPVSELGPTEINCMRPQLPTVLRGSTPHLPTMFVSLQHSYNNNLNQNGHRSNTNQQKYNNAPKEFYPASASASKSASCSSTGGSCDQIKPSDKTWPKQYRKETCQQSMDDSYKGPIQKPPVCQVQPKNWQQFPRIQNCPSSIGCRKANKVKGACMQGKSFRVNRWQEGREKPIPQEEPCKTSKKRKPWWQKFRKNSKRKLD